MGLKLLAAGLLFLVAPAAAQEAVPTEIGQNADSVVTLHLHPFLSDEELSTLRLVMTNDQALALFVPENTGFAAVAVSPDDGFVRDGAVVPSASALAGFANEDGARSAALAACDALRKGKKPCVLVLGVAAAK